MVEDLEHAAKVLEESGQFRVFRRLSLVDRLEPDDGTPTRTAIFLDVETTGLDLQDSEVIELAMVPFRYTPDGRIFSVGAPFHQFNQPTEPIPSEITAITGITDELVAGRAIQVSEVEAFAQNSALVIAHNAAFDRPFAERISPVFASKPWACTMCDINWREFGFEGRRLSDLLANFRYFFDAHRAIDDCQAGISLLTMPLADNGASVFQHLLDSARQSTWRIFADGAQFETKDVLKKRGYKWNPDRDLGPRAWWIDKPKDRLEGEISFLRTEIFHSDVELPMLEITAFQRYSPRLR